MNRRLIATLTAGALALGIIAAPVAARPVAEGSIVATAIALNTEKGGDYEGAFDTLIAAVLAADPVVANTLSQRGGYTVFAPTDDAFAAAGLNPSNVASLGKDKLTKILLYHVAKGVRYSGDVLDSSRIRTLYGTFLAQSGGVLTDALGRKSNIIVTDVPASNGVIHAIDGVLLPFVP